MTRLIEADELKDLIQNYCYEFTNNENLTLEKVLELIDKAPSVIDWGMYSDKLWKNAYERGKADAYEKAKPKVTVSVKVGNQTVETIEIDGECVRWSSSSL